MECFDHRMVKHCAGQVTVYIRAITNVNFAFIINGHWKKMEPDISASGYESDDNASLEITAQKPCTRSGVHTTRLSSIDMQVK